MILQAHDARTLAMTFCQDGLYLPLLFGQARRSRDPRILHCGLRQAKSVDKSKSINSAACSRALPGFGVEFFKVIGMKTE